MAAAAGNSESAPSPRQIVHIVEDDELLRLSLMDLFQSLEIPADGFESAADFFARASCEHGGCILLDVRLPDVSGIDFQRELDANGYQLPVVFMTGHGDVATSVHAMKAGAIDFLQKPLNPYELLDAINAAFAIDSERRKARAHHQILRARASSLTPRETQVMGLVASGLMNKQIAFELGISEIMVKLHRGSVMRKMKAGSLAELVRQFELLH
ncbi:response regulator transcription factor [Rhizobium mayense]|uniref:Response regulator n=1 Tax=Rhizobium mayense TaxID=1312184 RepID=A0ABT7JVM8_9HYPH|nr:response regulator [Rhizobium mayense]MDL2398974.1 response regulator [Rhizobium mayense]